MSTEGNLRADRSRFLTRRQFLAAGAAAAVAAPSLIPASALGRDGHTPPSERIAMGFIGLGGQGTGHLLGGAWTYVPGGYIARDDVQVLAVCDVRKERREPAHQRCNQIYAEKFGQAGYSGVQAYNDFREVLARPDIDAVLLALPYHWAALMATMAARSGKDVYCEKPICTTVREGRNLVETCQRFGRVYQAGMQQRSEYDGKFRLACELVRNGRIGQLQGSLCLPLARRVLPHRLDLGRIPARTRGLRLGPLARTAAVAALLRRRRPCPAGILRRRRELEPAPLRHRQVDDQPGSRRNRGSLAGERGGPLSLRQRRRDPLDGIPRRERRRRTAAPASSAARDGSRSIAATSFPTRRASSGNRCVPATPACITPPATPAISSTASARGGRRSASRRPPWTA